MIPAVWQLPSWSPSGCYLVKSAETKVAACRLNYLLTELTDSGLQWQKSWVLPHCHFPDRLFSKILVNYIFFYSSLQGYGACIYVESHNQFNLLVSSAKNMGKASYSAPQSKITSAVLAVKMERKITLELSNITQSEPMFIGDSEIVLKMIARNDPAWLPMFYGTRIMEISALSIADNWNWCPGSLNPADFLTRSGATLEKINSSFWLQGSFFPQPPSSWPTKLSSSLISDTYPSAVVKKISAASPHPLTELITDVLTHCYALLHGREYLQN